MRRLIDHGLILVASLFVWANLAYAQQINPDVQQAKPINPPENNSVVETNDRLERLFEKLASDVNPDSAKAIAGMIWRRWTDSGSDNINLLMEWTSAALERSDHGKALDLLDNVTVLAPEYAEGWNRRALVYFQIGDLGKSIADIETVLALESRHFGALSGLAVILQRIGRDREALNAWYKVLAVYPANQQAQKSVVELEEKLSGRRT